MIRLMSSEGLIRESYFTNNRADYVNHGITLITSKLEFYNSTVSFSPGFADNLDLSRLDAGFFSLFLGSNITIGESTEIRDLVAQN